MIHRFQNASPEVQRHVHLTQLAEALRRGSKTVKDAMADVEKRLRARQITKKEAEEEITVILRKRAPATTSAPLRAKTLGGHTVGTCSRCGDPTDHGGDGHPSYEDEDENAAARRRAALLARRQKGIL